MNRGLLSIASTSVSVAFALALPADAGAYESDVHFGLTRWIAMRAGFTEAQAQAIAVGDQRIDGGMLETLELGLEFACAGRIAEVARQAQRDHFPSERPVPAPAADRAVVPGSDAARAALKALVGRLPGKEGLMLGKFGEALHPLQDSWAHQGIPSTPSPGGSLRCDPSLFLGRATVRGGSASHAADATARWPVDALAMARATFEELVRYPSIDGRARNPARWDTLLPSLEGFVQATTKTQKRAWFVSQGMEDTGFLAGLTLPDGPTPGPLEWSGRRLLTLPGNASMQHAAPVDARAFVDRLLGRWTGAEPVEDVVGEATRSRTAHLPSGQATSPSTRELSARLKLWRMRDHGTAAELLHAPSPLTAAQLRAADRLTKAARALLPPMKLAEAVYPLQPSTPEPTPLLPYILHSLPEVDGQPRMIAIVKLRHAPYDTTGWIIEQSLNGWFLADLVSVVEP